MKLFKKITGIFYQKLKLTDYYKNMKILDKIIKEGISQEMIMMTMMMMMMILISV